MKKILFAIVLVFTMGIGANAQFDGFVASWEDNDTRALDGIYILLPQEHYMDGNTPAPLGSGLLVLTALGAGYAVARKHKH